MAQLHLKQGAEMALNTAIQMRAGLDLEQATVMDLQATLTGLNVTSFTRRAVLAVSKLNVGVRNLCLESNGDRLRAERLTLDLEDTSMDGEGVEGSASGIRLSLTLDQTSCPAGLVSLSDALGELEIAKGKVRFAGLYQHEDEYLADSSLSLFFQSFSLARQSGRFHFQGETDIQGPFLREPLTVGMDSFVDLEASSSNNLKMTIAQGEGGPGQELARITLALPPVQSLIHGIRLKDIQSLPLQASMQVNIPDFRALSTVKVGRVGCLPIRADLNSATILSWSGKGLFLKGQLAGVIDTVDGNLNIQVDTNFQGDIHQGHFRIGTTDSLSYVGLTTSGINWQGWILGGDLFLNQQDDTPLVDWSWGGKGAVLSFSTSVDINKPITLSPGDKSLENMQLNGALSLTGKVTDFEAEIFAKPKLDFQLSGSDASLKTLLVGDIETVYKRETGEITVGTLDGLHVEVSGNLAESHLFRPASFKINNGTESWLLRYWQGVSEVSAKLDSTGARLDFTLAGSRMVVRRDDLAVRLQGTFPGQFLFEVDVQELLFPELEGVVENIRTTVSFDSKNMSLEQAKLEIEKIKDGAIDQRFPGMSLNADITALAGQIKGDGTLTFTSGEKHIPLQIQVDLLATSDGQEGQLHLVAQDLGLAPWDINVKTLFPQSSQWVESVVSRADFSSSLSWNQHKEIPAILNSRLRLHSFEIDLAPYSLLDQGVTLVGGEILAFVHLPLDNPQGGSLVTHMDGINIESSQFSLFGLQGLDMLVEPLWPPSTPAPVTLTFDQLNGFLPFDRGTASLSLAQGKEFTLHNMRMYLAEGLVTAQPFTIDFTAPNDELYLKAEAISLSALRDRLQISLRDNLEVEGILYGDLPIHFSKNRVQLKNAVLQVREPGFLRYRPKVEKDWRRQTGKSTLQTVLDDLHFDKFTIALNGDLGKVITIDLHALGSNPELLWGMPIDLSLQIDAELEKLLSAYNTSIGTAERSYLIAD